jgi:hypothetical protein
MIIKTMKNAKNGKVEAAIYQCFIQERPTQQPISGPVLCEKSLNV